MPACAVASCRNFNQNTKGTDIKYYRFPKDEYFLNKWIAACRRKDKINIKNGNL